MATISITDFISWCKIYEPDAFASITIADDYITENYNSSIYYMESLKSYFDSNNYRILVYRYALHLIVINSSGQASPMNSLYTKYDIAHSGDGILSSASAEGSNSSYAQIGSIQNADAESIFLWSTPYGKQVEAVFTQLAGIGICITQ